MKTMKTSELSGAALDWAVAKCEGFVQADDPPWEAGHEPFAYSTDWALAGPIIERERIAIQFGPLWAAIHHKHLGHPSYGPTQLIAAMRCYAASKLGSVVEVPAAILKDDRP